MLFSRGAIPVYDLGGNVKEWVLDFYEDTQSRRRTLRGGSFRTSITDGLISQRESSPESDDSHDDVGFRCVVILDWNVMLDSRARDQAGRILRPPSR
jgi:formylglycine-generating enzyme required for sulfatase activity